MSAQVWSKAADTNALALSCPLVAAVLDEQDYSQAKEEEDDRLVSQPEFICATDEQLLYVLAVCQDRSSKQQGTLQHALGKFQGQFETCQKFLDCTRCYCLPVDVAISCLEKKIGKDVLEYIEDIQHMDMRIWHLQGTISEPLGVTRHVMTVASNNEVHKRLAASSFTYISRSCGHQSC